MTMEMTKSICRACLTENGTFQSIFLAKSNSRCSLHISEMISAFATIQVTKGDGLPKQICTECAEVTVKMYLFKLKCENSDKILKAKLKKDQAKTVDSSIKLQNKTKRDKKIFIEDIANFKNYKYKTDSNKKMLKTNNEIKIDYIDLAPKQLNNKEEFVCDICQEKFNQIDLLTSHETVHSMEMEELENNYENQVNQNSADPLIKETEKSKFTCPECDSVFVNKDNLDGHINDLHVKKESEASFDVDFEREKQLMDMKAILESKPFGCDICFEGFEEKSDLKDHMKTHILNSNNCSSNSTSLPKHKIINFGERKKTFKSSESADTTIQISEKLIERNVCQNKFTQLSSLKENKKLLSVKKIYDCNMCEKQYGRLQDLKRHKIHTGETSYRKKFSNLIKKKYGCNICNQKFELPRSLNVHKINHHLSYECDLCEKKFAFSSYLNTHKKIHTGVKPYGCDVCKKRFTDLSSLILHKRIHTDEKPYECDMCEKEFAHLSDLISHKRIHSE